MMKNTILIGGAALLFCACTPNAVEDKVDQNEPVASEDVSDTVAVLDRIHEVENERSLANGIRIKWYEHGEGDLLKQGDLVQIDYKVLLENGTTVDGNHLIDKESLPFMVGFGMQTEGWDIALKELRVGDFVELFIPSHLARGVKGIEGLIPPNSNNIVKIRILEKSEPTREVEGNKVWLFEENQNSTNAFGFTNEIEFHCMVSTPSNPLYVNTFSSNAPFKLKVQDGGTVPGLKKALINAKKSDRMFVLVPASEAYGDKGYQDVVKPNEDILYNILVMDVTPG